MTMFIQVWLLCQLALVSVEMLEPLPMMETFFGLKFPCTSPPMSCFKRCFGSNPFPTFGPSCMCDRLCVVFGDCCPDYYTYCNIFSNNDAVLNFIKSNGRTKLTEQEMNRIDAFADSSSCNKVMIGTYEKYIRSIATCNKDYRGRYIKDKCEGRQSAFPLDIPLSVLSTPFMTYKNVYCAVCNNLDLGEGIKYWSANIKCQVDNKDTLRTVEDLQGYPEERCQTVLTKPDDVQVRFCDRHLDHRSCSENNEVQISTKDSSEREVRSVSYSGLNVKDGYFGGGGVKDTSYTGRHGIRKRNADDTQEVNITLLNSGSEKTADNVTNVNAFDMSASSNDNLTQIDQTSTPSQSLKTASIPTDSVTITEQTIITAPVVKSETDSSNNTMSTVAGIDSPRDPLQAETNIQVSEGMNWDILIENNLPLLCDAYYFPYKRDGLRYKNPHCYACQHGWDVFKDTNTTSKRNEIECQYFGFFNREFGIWSKNTKEVNHQFAVYGNKFAFYSSDLGRVLGDVPSNCGISAVYDMISQSCKKTKCPHGLSPYYEACFDGSLHSLYISNFNHSTTLYVTMNGSATEIYNSYLDLVQNVVDDLESVDFNKLELDQSSGMDSVKRGVKITSLDLIKQGNITEHITARGVILEHSLTRLQLKVNVPILFKDTNQTLHDLMYGENKQFLLLINNMIIRNYEVGTIQACPIGILQTRTNLPMISIGRHVFVDIEKQLVDISKARFTIGRNANNSWIVESITYCDRIISAEGQTVRTISTMTLSCNNTVTLDRTMFEEIGERVVLKTGQLIAPGDFLRKDEELVVCRESLLPEQSLIQNPNSQILFKNTLMIISIILKLLAFLVSFFRKYSMQGGTYFYILAMAISLIDIVHLLENLTNVTSPTILPIMLHFSWLFALYNSMAWCINMIGSNSKRTTSCCCRHLVISATVPIATVVICALGGINEPPWDVGYGSISHIFSVKPNVVLYGYVLPASAAVVITTLCHIYRIVRRKMYENDKIFYCCNILVTSLLVVQFTFGCLESLEDSTVFYNLYFTSSIVVSWTFLAICVLIWMKKPTRLSSSLKYMETTTTKWSTKPENIYETAD